MARVLVSGNPEFKKDDLVIGLIRWGEYSVIKPAGGMLRKLDPMGFPLSHHVGVLGRMVKLNKFTSFPNKFCNKI